MKKIIFICIFLLGMFSLTGCNLQKEKTENLKQDKVDDTLIAKDLDVNTEAKPSVIPLEESAYEIVTGDNITIAFAFVKDVIEENFDKLTQSYQYDKLMKEAMNQSDTQKMIIYYNKQCGALKEIMDAYIINSGTNQQVMIPVKFTNTDINYCIVFDQNQNIIGFTYTDYSEKAKDKKIPNNIIEREYTFQSDELEFAGTLTTPKEEGNYPVVILVHGSGANDRDETIYQNKPFRDIAWALAEQGIASYRYDKRTFLYPDITASNKSFTVYDETINDAVAAAKMVSGLDNIDKSRVFILGHSLGGYLIPRIAELTPDVSGYIMMASPAQHMKYYIMDQYNFLVNEDGVVTTVEQTSLDAIKKQVKLIKKPDTIPENSIILGAYKNYWVDFNQYNAIKEAKNMKKSVLVLQGERDYQVTMKQFNLWKKAFHNDDKWEFKSYKFLNHLMMEGKGKPSSMEYKNASSVDQTVLIDIADFINKD